MYIPTQFLPIRAKKPQLVKRGEVTLEKIETDPDSTKQMSNAHVLMYDKRENPERRKRKIKPLLDTRSGRDRRYDKENPPIDIQA
jgi:hypothetical protein